MKSFFNILGICIATGVVCSLNAGEETAWTRKTMQDQQQQLAERNMSDFESELSAFGYKEYMKLSPEQKKRAMDYADNNKMSPDAAVMRVMAD
jgi:hypothetical protein